MTSRERDHDRTSCRRALRRRMLLEIGSRRTRSSSTRSESMEIDTDGYRVLSRTKIVKLPADRIGDVLTPNLCFEERERDREREERERGRVRTFSPSLSKPRSQFLLRCSLHRFSERTHSLSEATASSSSSFSSFFSSFSRFPSSRSSSFPRCYSAATSSTTATTATAATPSPPPLARRPSPT